MSKKKAGLTVDSQVTAIEVVQDERYGFSVIKAKKVADALVLQNLCDKYAICRHDEDSQYDATSHQPILDDKGIPVPREPHVHCYLHFSKKVRISQILKAFEICGTTTKSRKVGTGVDQQTVDEDAPVIEFNQLEKIKGWTAAMAYMIHANAPYKHQYERAEVISNFNFGQDIDDYLSDADQQAFETELMKGILDRTIRRCDLPKFFEGRETMYPRLETRLDKYFKLRDLQPLKDRQMQVCFIHGGSGAGKSTFAKMLAEKYHYSICEASSGKNPLDDYNEEDCFILSEFRGQGWSQSDLLMFLDNHTSAKQKARYRNVDFSSCKLVIICSTRSLDEIWEDTEAFDNREQRQQLNRRISTVVEMEKERVTVMHRRDGITEAVEQFDNPVSHMFEDYKPVRLDFSEWGAKSVEIVPNGGFEPIPEWFKDTPQYKQLIGTCA